MSGICLMKLKKEDVKYLEEQGFSKGLLQKGDYLVGKKTKHNRKNKPDRKFCPLLFSKEDEYGLCVKVYRPLKKDQVAFAFFGEKSLDLGKNGKKIWGDFATKINESIIAKDSGYYVNSHSEIANYFMIHCENDKYGMNLESNEKHDEKCFAKNIEPNIYLYSAANYAEYSEYAEQAKEISEKIEKQLKKLVKIEKDIKKTTMTNQRENQNQEKYSLEEDDMDYE